MTWVSAIALCWVGYKWCLFALHVRDEGNQKMSVVLFGVAAMYIAPFLFLLWSALIFGGGQ